MNKRVLFVVVTALLAGAGTPTRDHAQPPGGGACNPTGYIMYCRHTCVYEQHEGGGCENQGEEGPGTYCLEVMGVPGVCLDGSGDDCCKADPAF